MERLDLGKRETLPVSIFDQDIDLKMPAMADIVEMQTAIEKAKDDKSSTSFKAVETLVIKMGMPEEICKEMQIDHFQVLIDHIVNRKKK